MGISQSGAGRTPWHIWVVGVLTLLWYLSGAISIIAAQHGTMPSLAPDEAAYYAAKPLWLEIMTDIGLIACVAGSLGLLLRKKLAVPCFALASVLILIQNVYELLSGTSRAYANSTAAIVLSLIMVIVLACWLYAKAMKRRGILR